MRSGAEEVVERLDPVARDHDAVGDVALPERAQRQRFVVRVVFDQQDGGSFISSPPPSRRA